MAATTVFSSPDGGRGKCQKHDLAVTNKQYCQSCILLVLYIIYVIVSYILLLSEVVVLID